MGDSTSTADNADNPICCGTAPRVRQAAEPPQSPGSCYMCYMCYWVLHAKPRNLHFSPSSLLYVLYVL